MSQHLWRRRDLLATAAGAALSQVLHGLRPMPAKASHDNWSRAGLEALRRQLRGELLQPALPWQQATKSILAKLRNPFWIQDQPGGLQSTGWLNGWTASASRWAIAATCAEDLAAGVNFARDNNLRLVVKGAGHDYLGRNCAPDSLLLWTHRMRQITVHEAFLPEGAPAGTKAEAAITVQAGNRWLEVYEQATRAGRYVQGGGCTSVGACGGFVLGSGFGSFSKRFGTGAANLLQAKVITADGVIRTVNAHQHPDLFFALRGGGPCTFAVLSEITLLSHPIPQRLTVITGGVQASTDAAYRELIEAFMRFAPGTLDNPSWGEQVKFGPNNTLGFTLTALDLDSSSVRSTFEAFLLPFRARPQEFEVQPVYTDLPFKQLWNASYWEDVEPSMIKRDPRPGSPANRFWWGSNQVEVGAFWNSYDSLWVSAAAMGDQPSTVADAFFEASRHKDFALHLNKGLSGEHPQAKARDEETCLNPSCFDAIGLVIAASLQQYRYPGLKSHEPDRQQGAKEAARVAAVMQTLRQQLPDLGTYSPQTNYFQSDAARDQWGSHYPQLLAIKRRWDPTNLFQVHNGVGNITPPEATPR